MEKDIEMYSNEIFASVLTNLMNGYNATEISNALKEKFGTTISSKQLNNYMNGTAVPKADSLYLLAEYFRVQIDGLVGRCEIDDFYFSNNPKTKNKYNLNVDSRNKLSNMEIKKEIDVLNEMINSNIIETFATQLQTASAQIKTTDNKEIRNAIITYASHNLQIEIDKLFRKHFK